MIQILTNQMGYLSKDVKRAVFQGKEGQKASSFQIKNEKGESPIHLRLQKAF